MFHDIPGKDDLMKPPERMTSELTADELADFQRMYDYDPSFFPAKFGKLLAAADENAKLRANEPIVVELAEECKRQVGTIAKLHNRLSEVKEEAVKLRAAIEKHKNAPLGALELLERWWEGGNKSRSLQIWHDDGKGASCWSIEMSGNGKEIEAHEIELMRQTGCDWPGLAATIRLALQRADEAGL